MSHRVQVILIGLSAIAVGPILSAQAVPFSCTANAGVPPILRAEGLTELVGDVVLGCTGGEITQRGVPVPLVSLQLFLNTNIASRVFSGNVSEALLLVPGLFSADNSGIGQAAALNQDGSFNGPGNPAAPGDIVVLFGTGGGQTNPGGRDGRISGSGAPVGELTQEVKATIDGEPAEVLYGGPAPGLVEGVLQANVRLQPGARTGNLTATITVGWKPTQFGVTVAVRRPNF
ncbi:MAG: hypothetical protein ACRD44_07380 [Bryobacteraceae bacterium]